MAFFNDDDAFTIEASASAKRLIGAVTSEPRVGRDPSPDEHTEARTRPKEFDFLRDRAVNYTRTASVLDKVISTPWRQAVEVMMLDYEPWVRAIDRSDTEQEKIAASEAGMRAVVHGGRVTRNSNRAVYERYFELGGDERRGWQEIGFGPMAS